MTHAADIFADAVAALHEDSCALRYLARMGLPDPHAAAPALYGVASVTTRQDGAFLSGGPTRVVVVAEWDDPDPLGAELVDLVAFTPRAPHLWWRLTGETDLLGSVAIRIATVGDRTLDLKPTPLDWLRHPGGACVLDWTRFDPRARLAALDDIRCATPELRDRFRARDKVVSRPGWRLSVAASTDHARAA